MKTHTDPSQSAENPSPKTTPTREQQRTQKLAIALRENLLRRKRTKTQPRGSKGG